MQPSSPKQPKVHWLWLEKKRSLLIRLTLCNELIGGLWSSTEVWSSGTALTQETQCWSCHWFSVEPQASSFDFMAAPWRQRGRALSYCWLDAVSALLLAYSSQLSSNTDRGAISSESRQQHVSSSTGHAVLAVLPRPAHNPKQTYLIPGQLQVKWKLTFVHKQRKPPTQREP